MKMIATMSDWMRIEFRYDVPYTSDDVEAVLRILAKAVDENWKDRDEWSSPRPDLPVDVEGWQPLLGPERLAWDDIFKHWRPRAENAPEWKFTELRFSFSPLSINALSIKPIKQPDESLVMQCLINSSVFYELRGDRQCERMEDEWDRIRAGRGEPEPRERGPDMDDPEYEGWWDKHVELEETFSVWPQVKRHLRHIIEALRVVLPVRDERIDPRLQGADPALVTDESLRGRRNLFPEG
jgi:hypothetical protein